jgi:hypothetical protein
LVAPKIHAGEFAIGLTASPPFEQLIPGAEAARLIVTVISAEDRRGADGSISVRLDAPPPGGFLSTDLPLVEGTRLLEMRVPLIDGRAEWRQAFPIRGEYRLTAEFAGSGGLESRRTVTFYIHENSRKWLVLGAFAAALFIAGVAAGRVFSAAGGLGRSSRGLLLVVVLYVSSSTAHASEQAPQQREQLSMLEVGPAAVGVPALIRWRFDRTGVNPEPPIKLTLTVVHRETSKVVFALEKITVAHEFALDYQFTDGAEHRVTAVAESNGSEIARNEQTVDVRARAPSLRQKLPPLVLSGALLIIGLVAGRCSAGLALRSLLRRSRIAP